MFTGLMRYVFRSIELPPAVNKVNALKQHPAADGAWHIVQFGQRHI